MNLETQGFDHIDRRLSIDITTDEIRHCLLHTQRGNRRSLVEPLFRQVCPNLVIEESHDRGGIDNARAHRSLPGGGGHPRIELGFIAARFIASIGYDLINDWLAGGDKFAEHRARALSLPLGRRQFDAIAFGFDDNLVSFF